MRYSSVTTGSDQAGEHRARRTRIQATPYDNPSTQQRSRCGQQGSRSWRGRRG